MRTYLPSTMLPTLASVVGMLRYIINVTIMIIILIRVIIIIFMI